VVWIDIHSYDGEPWATLIMRQFDSVKKYLSIDILSSIYYFILIK